ncbi:hypothetical protein [Mixta sp. Marseille-Q2659]|uniref:hypothetical protein n=1 Tax=Mixta sp. Marseille-Q2659 TaxID=2736607 RepID=UPI0023B94889|nr:hypothetical protein [Mixta sp. Marseille-Q2659]
MLDYISQLPLPEEQIPQGLKDLLLPENNTNSQKEVIVTHRYEKNKYQKNYEHAQMLMAVVPEEDIANLTVLPESTDCVVAYSRPYCTQKGGVRGQKNSISGFGYIVASWGDGSHYSFFLAEDVWMKLGLTPRLTGDIEQRVIFDDASKPIFGVVKGDVSCKFFFESSKDIVWTMQNDYLRKYLWMKNCVGVKVFHYEAYINRSSEVKDLLSGSNTYQFNRPWIDLEITDHTDHVILQAWGTIQSVNPERCDKLDINTLIWPGHASPMTRSRARDIRLNEYVFVDDSFLTKYEEDASYDAVPFLHGNHYHVNPSYGGQWSFRDCIRVGRNLVKMPFYELYRAVPDKEVAHVFDYAIDPSLIDDDLLKSEHIVSKTFRFANELFELNKNLVLLGDILDIPLSNADIF